MGQHLGPAGVFMKILMSGRFKTVCKQANLLLVCGHVSYKGNARVAGSQWCFAPLVWALLRSGYISSSIVCVCCWLCWWERMFFFSLPFHKGAVNLWAVSQLDRAAVPAVVLMGVGQNSASSKIRMVLNPLSCGHRGRSDPTPPCAHPSSACHAILGIPMSLPVSGELQSIPGATGEQVPRLEESLRILELHLSSHVLWDTWKASKTDTCWLWGSQVLFPKHLWPLFWMFTFKKIQACVGCKRKEGGVEKSLLLLSLKFPADLKGRWKLVL